MSGGLLSADSYYSEPKYLNDFIKLCRITIEGNTSEYEH